MTTKSKETKAQPARGRNGGNGAQPREIIVEDHITVRKLAERMQRSPIDLIKVLMQFGIMAPIDQALDHDTAAIVGEELGVDVLWPKGNQPEPESDEPAKADTRTKAQVFVDEIIDHEQESNLVERPPVVAVLGHVDHGKTTLLDRIRKTNVVATEAGGITQHTGAYQVEVEGRKITFLDTPGHEAFTSMRARGAQVTDIVVLVVAADDGVMPQTKEAINHAKAAGVTIVVAINKIDRANANPGRVMEELAKEGLQPEAWGGDTIMVQLSALTGLNIEELLTNLLVVAEIEQLRANPKGKCVGTIIESELDKHRGVTSTLLVQNGTLNRGDVIVVGKTWGRIKAMFDHEGNQIKKATPSTPVVVLGIQDVPTAGDIFEVMAKDKDARRIAEERQAEADAISRAPWARPQLTLEDFFARIEEGETKTLNLIVRADVQGTLEPVVNSLEQIATSQREVQKEVSLKILQSAIGDISESDVMLAEASEAIIIGFNVDIDKSAAMRAENSGVEIRNYDVIYHMIEDIELALTGMLEPVYKEVTIGRAEVRQLFRVRRGGLVAGCMVLDGMIKRNAGARLIRGGKVEVTSTISTLKRFTEDVGEVRTGYECGINLAGINENMQEGDIIEVFEKQQVR